ncbi:HAD family hydrolase [Nocardia blacklockiae]|uniref:HAD family hydrolase n=1 Tax=Nocardia blacklockiae TaxID=480036 RepID=UPI00189354C6|nr:HAD-IA family hydrolase [Nocardia blacklockiae]MBF6176786.1 HAD-IA family hydrolase [Nocardia blacklockiae]
MRNRSPKYAALFDLDGVIIDTRSATRTALCTLAGQWAETAVDSAALDGCIALPPVDALVALGVPDAPRVYLDHFDVALSTAVGRELRVFEATVSGMAALAEEGAGLGVVTAQARRRLDFLLPPSVAELVDVVIAHEDAPPKPAPDGVLAACTALGVTAERAFFLGDTSTDVAAGRAAGALTAGAGWGFVGPAALYRAGADVVLTEPEQVGPDMLAHVDDRPTRRCITG